MGELQMSLETISPLDGRYYAKLGNVRHLFSEKALFRNRVKIEILWFIHMAENKIFSFEMTNTTKEILYNIMNISLEDAVRIKKIEEVLNHDVKSVEIFIKEKIRDSNVESLIRHIEMFHFGCTSEDINNLSYALIFKEAVDNIIIIYLKNILKVLKDLAVEYADVEMLALTHGQPASPTTFGKEMAVFASRIHRHINHSLLSLEFLGKFNGSVGNFNAHYLAIPDVDWISISKSFVENKLGLKYQLYSTQIEPHDFVCEMCDAISRVNSTIIDLNCDIWNYISRDFIKLKMTNSEVGSSTMPHKINPIDFENSEGNLGISNSLLKFFSAKLPISRMQRDLSDSTVMRNVGVAIGHAAVGYLSTIRGLSKIIIDRGTITKTLDSKWDVIAEAIQTMLRKHNSDSPYELLKELTRGADCTKERLKSIINHVAKDIPDKDLHILFELSPRKYVGIAKRLALEIDQHTK